MCGDLSRRTVTPPQLVANESFAALDCTIFVAYTGLQSEGNNHSLGKKLHAAIAHLLWSKAHSDTSLISNLCNLNMIIISSSTYLFWRRDCLCILRYTGP